MLCMTRILLIFIFLLATSAIKGQTPLWKLKFKSNEIYEWHIYYDRGNLVDSTNPNKSVFAIAGDSAKLKALGVDTLLNKMFDALRSAKIKKRTTVESFIGDPNPFNYQGKPEHISIWWKTGDDINYYRILVTLKESPNIREEKLNFVLVCAGPSGNTQTFHYVEKKNVMIIESIMNYIATKNWGDNYVKKP